MSSSPLLYSASVVLFASLVVPSSAHAGCEKDTDCKGDRICEAGTCRDPSDTPQAPGGVGRPIVPAPPALPTLKESAEQQSGQGVDTHGIERRMQYESRRAGTGLGITLGGMAFGIPASIMGIQEVYWPAPTSLGAVGLILASTGGGIAIGASRDARVTLARAGGSSGVSGSRVLGVGLYGIGVGLGAGAIAGGIAQIGEPGGYLGLGAVGCFGLGTAVLFADVKAAHSATTSALELADVERTPKTTLSMSPVLSPQLTGLAIKGQW